MARKTDQAVRREGDTVYISRPETYKYIDGSGEVITRRVAVTPKPEYEKEIANCTWSLNGKYPYCEKHGFLHRYIARQWYGEEFFEEMMEKGCVVEHIDNDAFNCRISNLYFLEKGRNTAKGQTIDKDVDEPLLIAWSLYRDFEQKVFQAQFSFNCEAALIASANSGDTVAEWATLLWGCDYKLVLNDIDSILLDYREEQIFRLDALRCSDFYIEGREGSITPFEKYLERKLDAIAEGGSVFHIVKPAMETGLTVGCLGKTILIRPSHY